MNTNKFLSLIILYTCIGCVGRDPQREVITGVDPIGTKLEASGVWGIEFFDAQRTLHKPIRGITSCDGRPCEYKSLVFDSITDTAILMLPPEDSLVSYDAKLREYGAEINSRIPERGRVIVGIAVNEVANDRDVLGVVTPILERYSIRPETIEVISLPRDSIRVATSRTWRLIGDSVVFRHIVNVHIQRFVRR